jgi:uncharacterized phiE125 gp8 family phage protein
MTVRLEPKRATEVRNYKHDWSAFLGTDTIASQTTTSSDVTISAAAPTDGNTAVEWKISGGTDGTTALIAQTIVTAAGLTETEVFSLQISAGEPVSLGDVKRYLRVTASDEDGKIEAMIPRARLWVEDYTGLALVQREFTERHLPKYGAIRLFRGPLVELGEVAYTNAAGAQTYEPRTWPPSSTIFPVANGIWPILTDSEQFGITYTAGFAEGEVDERLIGAMLALIEGEFSDGYAYPERATDAAERCCAYLRQMVA